MSLRNRFFYRSLLAVMPCLSSLGYAQTTGKLSIDRWNNLSNKATLTELQQEAIAKRAADVPMLLSGASFGSFGENYGARLRGTVTAPVTGNYTFFVSGDDNAGLWLSNDDTAFNKEKVAWHYGYSNVNEWGKYATQRSKTVKLQAGQKYYIEAQVKEGVGQDHLSIGWSYEADSAVSWTNLAIGGGVTQRWTELSGGDVLDISVSAGQIKNTNDHFGFRYRTWTGDGEIIAKIYDMNNPHEDANVGVMIRSSLVANSAHATVMRTGSNGMLFSWRDSAGASTGSLGGAPAHPHKDWVRLVRKGDEITSYVSDDGEEWVEIGSRVLTGLPQTIYVGVSATDDAGADPVTARVSDVQVRPLLANEVIPAAHLTSYGHANDTDGNGLPDDWEATNGIGASGADLTTGKYGEYGDFDGDGLNNLLEYQLGTDPSVANVRSGYLLRETWLNIVTGQEAAQTVSQMTSSDVFKSHPNEKKFVSNVDDHERGERYGTRYRGNIVAPTSGNYTFWISGDDESELWLADGSVNPNNAVAGHKNAYGKQKLAWIHDQRRDENYTTDEDFDKFASQRSKSVYLEAGQSYYIEVLHKEGAGRDHVTVAWQVPREQRVIIPSTAFTTYIPDTDDLDRDNLPDGWETLNGLNASNNGYGNSTEGEYGDLDGDGLSNLLEYQLGTHPNNTDTDGDGFSDQEEYLYYKSDPTQSNQLDTSLHTELPLGQYQTATSDWYIGADGSLTASSRRGKITYPFTVVAGEEGMLEVKLVASVAGVNAGSQRLPLKFELNGELIGSHDLVSVDGNAVTIKKLTPWLKAGNYQLTIRNLNYKTAISLRIESLTLTRIGGADSDGNGVPDWADQQIASENYTTRFPTTSFTSPAFIEGNTSHLSALSIQATASDNSILNIPIEESINDGFYANIPLSTSGATPVTVAFHNGALDQQTQITWQPVNMLQTSEIKIRKGDSIRLAAWQGASISGNFTLNHDGSTVNNSQGGATHTNAHTLTFNTAGSYTYTTTWTSADGTQTSNATTKVVVIGADFGDSFPVMLWNQRNWTPNLLPYNVVVEADDALVWTETTGSEINWANHSGSVATQSSTLWGAVASKAIDGNRNGHYSQGLSTTHTDNIAGSWWQVDLGTTRVINRVRLWNRTDGSTGRLSNYKITVYNAAGNEVASQSFHTTTGRTGRRETWDLDAPVNGKVVKVELLGANRLNDHILSLAEVEVIELKNPSSATIENERNWAIESGAVATQSTVILGGVASKAIDGNTDGYYSGGSVTHTDNVSGSWWQVDLGATREIDRIRLWNRSDSSASRRLANYKITILDDTGSEVISKNFHEIGSYSGRSETWTLDSAVNGKVVKVELLGKNRYNDDILSIAECEVIDIQNPTQQADDAVLAENNWTNEAGVVATQSSILLGGIASRAIDGNTDGDFSAYSLTHTDNTAGSWWQVDLGALREIDRIRLWNRTDGSPQRLSNYKITIFDDNGNALASKSFHTATGHSGENETWTLDAPVQGKVVKVELLGANRLNDHVLSLAEVEVIDLIPRSFDVTAEKDVGSYHVIARMPDTGEIITRGTVSAFDIAETDQTLDTDYIKDLGNGEHLLSFSIVADNLPANAVVRLESYFDDTIFLDGGDVLLLTAADFDENGIATFFLETTDELKSCHFFYVYLDE